MWGVGVAVGMVTVWRVGVGAVTVWGRGVAVGVVTVWAVGVTSICHVTQYRQRQYRLNFHFLEVNLFPGSYMLVFVLLRCI